jgi:Holliday junction resolvase RusA-like endonuclease
MKLILPGRPYTKKNSQRILKNHRTGRPFIAQSEQYEQYEEQCLWYLNGKGEAYQQGIHLICRYWMPDLSSWPDLVGLIQATQDILQKDGIIKNDRQVCNLDGSRIVGVDKQNPRTEIIIEEME